MRIDWDHIERLMYRGKTRGLSAEETALCARAFRQDAARYTALKRRIDAEAHRDANPWGGE